MNLPQDALFNSTTNAEQETVVWSGKPSQLINVKHFFTSIFLCLLIVFYYLYSNNNYVLWLFVIPFFTSFWAWLYVNQTQYILTNERFVKKYGILNRHTFDVELYRVKDVHLMEPIVFRIFRLGTINLITSQQATLNFKVPGVKYSKELREQVRKLVEERRIKKGVREFDTN